MKPVATMRKRRRRLELVSPQDRERTILLSGDSPVYLVCPECCSRLDEFPYAASLVVLDSDPEFCSEACQDARKNKLTEAERQRAINLIMQQVKSSGFFDSKVFDLPTSKTRVHDDATDALQYALATLPEAAAYAGWDLASDVPEVRDDFKILGLKDCEGMNLDHRPEIETDNQFTERGMKSTHKLSLYVRLQDIRERGASHPLIYRGRMQGWTFEEMERAERNSMKLTFMKEGDIEPSF